MKPNGQGSEKIRWPESFRTRVFIMVAIPVKMTTAIFQPKLEDDYYNLG